MGGYVMPLGTALALAMGKSGGFRTIANVYKFEEWA